MNGGSVPAFVRAILATYIIFFITFPLNMGLQYARIGPWGDRYWGTSQGDGARLGSRHQRSLTPPPTHPPTFTITTITNVHPDHANPIVGYEKGGYYFGEIVYQVGRLTAIKSHD